MFDIREEYNSKPTTEKETGYYTVRTIPFYTENQTLPLTKEIWCFGKFSPDAEKEANDLTVNPAVAAGKFLINKLVFLRQNGINYLKCIEKNTSSNQSIEGKRKDLADNIVNTINCVAHRIYRILTIINKINENNLLNNTVTQLKTMYETSFPPSDNITARNEKINDSIFSITCYLSLLQRSIDSKDFSAFSNIEYLLSSLDLRFPQDNGISLTNIQRYLKLTNRLQEILHTLTTIFIEAMRFCSEETHPVLHNNLSKLYNELECFLPACQKILKPFNERKLKIPASLSIKMKSILYEIAEFDTMETPTKTWKTMVERCKAVKEQCEQHDNPSEPVSPNTNSDEVEENSTDAACTRQLQGPEYTNSIHTAETVNDMNPNSLQ